jgi:large subunit ribosomal protein L10
MNREEKSATIQEIAGQIEASEAIFAVDYRGISVPQAAELRTKLREADASFRIVKNRLTKLAAEQAGEGRLDDLLQGPTALAFVRGDTAQAAKAISTFNKEHEVLTYKGGFMGETVLDPDSFKSISLLPSYDVLIGQFAGVVASPITGLVRGLGAMIGGLALQLGQIAEQGLVTGEAPAAAAAGPVTDETSSTSPASAEDPSSASPADEATEEAPPEPEAEQEDTVGQDTAETSEPTSQSDSSEASEEAPESEQAEADPDAPGSEAEDAAETDKTSEDSNEEEG